MSESYPTKINPILYNRLHFAVEGLASGVDMEVEFVARHLDPARHRFRIEWGTLPTVSADDRHRFVDGAFDTAPAFWIVEARLVNNVIELRNVRILLDPTTA